MKKILLTTAIFLCVALSFSKEKVTVDMKDDTVLVNGNPVFILMKIKNAFIPVVKDMYLENLQGKKLMYFQINQFNDPPNGSDVTYYYDITFLESGSKAEARWFFKVNKLAEWLVSLDIIHDGKISDEDEQQFVFTNGKRFSARRNELYGNNNNGTIIINNNSNNPPPPPVRTGVNINIGY